MEGKLQDTDGFTERDKIREVTNVGKGAKRQTENKLTIFLAGYDPCPVYAIQGPDLVCVSPPKNPHTY